MDLSEAPILGNPGPDISGLDAPFWEGLNAGELRLQHCAGCGDWIWTPQWRCGACGSWDLAWESTPMSGEVYSWTRTHHAFAPGMGPIVPFVTVLVALSRAGGRRLMGMLVGNEAGLRIGVAVNGVIQAPDEAGEQSVLRWRLAEPGESA